VFFDGACQRGRLKGTFCVAGCLLRTWNFVRRVYAAPEAEPCHWGFGGGEQMRAVCA
jgi:hypothetical protein